MQLIFLIITLIFFNSCISKEEIIVNYINKTEKSLFDSVLTFHCTSGAKDKIGGEILKIPLGKITKNFNRACSEEVKSILKIDNEFNVKKCKVRDLEVTFIIVSENGKFLQKCKKL